MRYQFKGPRQYRHQRTTFDALIKHPRFGVFSQPGTGKTRSVVCAADARRQAGISKRALYVCPNAVRQTIGREIEQWTDCSYTILDGDTVKRAEQLKQTDTFFYIINYRSCVLLEPQLLKKDFDILICDESTRVRTASSQTHMALKHIAKECKVRWLMTGTPMPRDPWDFFGQFTIIDERIFGSKTFFRDEYCIYGTRKSSGLIPQLLGYKNKDDLKKRVADFSIRYLKSQCLDLPEKVFVTCDVPLAPKQRRVYNEFVSMMMAELPSGEIMPIKSAMSKFMRFQQTASGFVGSGLECEWLGDNAKFAYLMDLLKTLQLHENKVIIWCTWIPSIEMLAAELAVHQPALFYGGVKDQDTEIQRFKDDPDCRLDQLSLVSGVEYEDRFECVYHLLSTVLMHDLVIKAHLDKDAPCVPTVSDVHPTANWHERETWDLVGIRFEGHPDPRRIYLPADWEGHPLQRDYVFPNEFNGMPLTDQHGPVKQAEEGPSETAQS